MDVLRTVSSFLGTLEPEEDLSDAKVSKINSAISISIRLVSLFGPSLLYWHHFHKSGGKLRIETRTS